MRCRTLFALMVSKGLLGAQALGCGGSSEPSPASGNEAGAAGTSIRAGSAGTTHLQGGDRGAQGGEEASGGSGGAGPAGGATPQKGGTSGRGQSTDAGQAGAGAAGSHAGAAPTAGASGGGGELPAGGGGASSGPEEEPEHVEFVPGAQVSTLTGSSASGLVDGGFRAARFDNPVNLALAGDLLYVADFENAAIRVVDLAHGTVSTLYQNPDTFCRPFGLALGGPNELYVQTDCGPRTEDIPLSTDGVVWKLDTRGESEPELVLEANGRPRGLLYLPEASTGGAARLVLGDMVNHAVGLLDLETGEATILAGLPGNPGYTDARGASARFRRPYGLARLESDVVVVCDKENHVLRRVTLDGNVTTLAGVGQPGMVDGPVEAARFREPQDVAADARGTLYVADRGNHRIRVIYKGMVRTLAGAGEASFADGSGAEARFFGLEGLEVTADGSTLYVADGNGGDPGPYHRIRVVTVPELE